MVYLPARLITKRGIDIIWRLARLCAFFILFFYFFYFFFLHSQIFNCAKSSTIISSYIKLCTDVATVCIFIIMSSKRSQGVDEPQTKRQKTLDPKDNPYLAHMYEDNASNGYGNGAENSPLAKFERHKTTAKMARKVEDSEVNPFNGKPLSQRYMSILKTRRDLPVHAQRSVNPYLLEYSFLICARTLTLLQR